jgi:hydroxyethylthiazole kinase-like uncharacterized protein yjeF
MSKATPLTLQVLRGFPLPVPAADVDKNTRGTALIAGGSAISAGSVALCGTAALRAGAGRLLLAVPDSLALTIGVGFPEAGVHGFACTPEGDPAPSAVDPIRALLPRAEVAVIGPGFTNEPAARQLTRKLLNGARGPVFVVDALSLHGLRDSQAEMANHRGKLALTPNAEEMARLLGASKQEVAAAPLRFGAQAASDLGSVVVLKGATTVIADPEGPLFVHESSNPGLAISGSGDVLAGVLAGLVARGMRPLEAALWSVHLHAEAAVRLSERIGPIGFLASELPAEIPMLMRSLS